MTTNTTVSIIPSRFPKTLRSRSLSPVISIFLFLLAAGTESAFGQNPLADGIRLYETGKSSAALNAFTEAVNNNQRCPLAYYYAARIRIENKQYDRARTNLAKAISDSTGFYDASALMAVTLMKLGETDGAQTAWKRFINGVGVVEGFDVSSTASIMYPEDYRQLLADERNRRSMADSLSRIADTGTPTNQSIYDQSDTGAAPGMLPAANTRTSRLAQSPSAETLRADGASSAVDSHALAIEKTPLGDIERRIRSDFRAGVLVTAAVVLLFAGVCIFILARIRRKRRSSDEVTFSNQVERLLDDMRFELDEDRTAREFEQRKKEIAQEIENIRYSSGMGEQRTPDTVSPSPGQESAESPEQIVPLRQEQWIPESMRKAIITEEVKVLVSKLSREGKTPEQIAQIADLTTTEVNLILAVRERRVENMAVEIHQTEEFYERDQLLSAIAGLREEGASNREIARKLDISQSEVDLAISILEHHNIPPSARPH